MSVEHMATEELARRDLDHRNLLKRRASGGRPHAHVGGATGNGGLLQGNDASACLGCSDRCGKATQTRGNDNDVGL